jgi:hypothetical protein
MRSVHDTPRSHRSTIDGPTVFDGKSLLSDEVKGHRDEARIERAPA